jgi:hypothetical protein
MGDEMTLDDMELIAEHLSDDEVMMVDITQRYKAICAMWYRRRVYFSETVWRMLCCAMADDFVYARTRATKYEPYVRHGALFHILKCSRKNIVRELGNHKALFRCSLRWDNQHRLFVLATIRNQQQIMIVCKDELEQIYG